MQRYIFLIIEYALKYLFHRVDYINGSEALAEEMLYNLIENAVRYNHAGGSVSVRVSQGAASEEVLEALRAARCV